MAESQISRSVPVSEIAQAAAQAAAVIVRALSETHLNNSASQSPPAVADAKESHPKEDECWPKSLDNEEIPRLTELGLGKAVDVSQQQKWENKTTYQAREVEPGDLVVIAEGFNTKRFAETVESYHQLQASIGSSVAVPNMPIQISVAADAKRGFSSAQYISGETVITRTVAFKTSPSTQVHPREYSHYKSSSPFETHLRDWLMDKECTIEKGNHECIMECRRFLRAHGGVTHYISSITLGAMQYAVRKSTSSKTVASSSASIAVPSAGSGGAGTKLTKILHRKHEQEELLGRIPKNDSIIQPRSTSEAVIRFSITPLTNLVVDHNLRGILETAIKQYVSVNSFEKRGPFKIMSAELVSSNQRVFWDIAEKSDGDRFTYKVGGIVEGKKAKKFYIRPDPMDEKGEMFFITTVGGKNWCESGQEDSELNCPDMFQSQHAELVTRTTPESDKHQQKSHADPNPGDSEHVDDLERYIHVESDLRPHHRFSLRAYSTVDRKKALFKLIDRVSHKCISLKDPTCTWLPTPGSHEAGDAYFIQPQYRPGYPLHKPVVALARHRPRETRFYADLCRKSESSHLHSHRLLFKLKYI